MRIHLGDVQACEIAGQKVHLCQSCVVRLKWPPLWKEKETVDAIATGLKHPRKK